MVLLLADNLGGFLDESAWMLFLLAQCQAQRDADATALAQQDLEPTPR